MHQTQTPTPNAPSQKKKSGKGWLWIIVFVLLFVILPNQKQIGAFITGASSTSGSHLSQSDTIAKLDSNYNDSDLTTPGKTWDGTEGSQGILDYKPSVTTCTRFTDEDKKPAIRCIVKWTNPYKFSFDSDADEYPLFTAIADVDDSSGLPDANPGEKSPYYEESYSYVDKSVSPGKTTSTPMYFEPGKAKQVWVSYERWDKGRHHYLDTSVAKVDLTNFQITNATWK